MKVEHVRALLWWLGVLLVVISSGARWGFDAAMLAFGLSAMAYAYANTGKP